MVEIRQLISLLAPTLQQDSVFIGQSQDLGFPKVFGGQVIAQALSAAMQTVQTRTPNSLHAYFIAPGKVDQEIHYEVEVIRDGRSFSVRRVLAKQADKTILALTASFQIDEPGLEYQSAAPAVPGPEHFKSVEYYYQKHINEIPESIRSQLTAPRPIEIRSVEQFNPFRPSHNVAKRHLWIKAKQPVEDDLLVHQMLLAYTSDFGFLETSLFPHGKSVLSSPMNIASLDHAIWFHRPFRIDDWLLYVSECPSTSNARGYVRGEIYNQKGVLVASIAQEGLIRVPLNEE